MLPAVPFIDADAAADFDPALITAMLVFPRVMIDLIAINKLSRPMRALLRPGEHDVVIANVRSSSDRDLIGVFNEGPRRVILPCSGAAEINALAARIAAVVDEPQKVLTNRIVFWLREELGHGRVLASQQALEDATYMLSVKAKLLVADEDDLAAKAAFDELVQLSERSKLAKAEPVRIVLTSSSNGPKLDADYIAKLKAKLEGKYIRLVLPADVFSLEPTPQEIHPADVILASLTTDRSDGLYSTLVTDKRGVAMGLVYSNRDSLVEMFATGKGVYWSRQRGLWRKGETSGCDQRVHSLGIDCDSDVLRVLVHQEGRGFCHLETWTCFGKVTPGIGELDRTLHGRMRHAPEGSYSARLFSNPAMLRAKILEEAEELCQARSPKEATAECADLIYFALAKVAAEGASLTNVERELERRRWTVRRRRGDAKPEFIEKERNMTDGRVDEAREKIDDNQDGENRQRRERPQQRPRDRQSDRRPVREVVPLAETGPIMLTVHDAARADARKLDQLLRRPTIDSEDLFSRVDPIIEEVRRHGDAALLHLTEKFDRVKLDSPVLVAPFDNTLLEELKPATRAAIDLAYDNIRKFHLAQVPPAEIKVETQPGVNCSRIWRPIARVGLYVPGGTAVLPSTALMLGVAAQVAGCQDIWLASPPNKEGFCAPEIIYAAQKVGAKGILLAGGAQAIAAFAYGTESVPKVDKICGPGNQYVTAAKMLLQTESDALVSIDMPAGPSELLVIADEDAIPAYVAADLLSQAEHGVDSQVILLAVGMSDVKLDAILQAIDEQAQVLPRVDIIRRSIAKSYALKFDSAKEAITFANRYAPEHLILQLKNARDYIKDIQNAGAVFVGKYAPESCGDYASGPNHTLPTYGYAVMYSGVGTDTFIKYITTQELTAEGLENIGDAVMELAEVEGLQGHRNAVAVRLDDIRKK